MIHARDYTFKYINIIIDFCLAIVAFLLAHCLRNLVLAPYFFPNFLLPSSLGQYIQLLFIFPPLAILILSFNGYYRPLRMMQYSKIFSSITISCIEILVAIAFLVFILRRADVVSRGQIILAPATLWFLLIAKSSIVRYLLAQLRKRGKHCLSVLLVGSGKRLEDFISLLESHPVWGFKVEGIVSDRDDVKIGSLVRNYPVVEHAGRTLEYLEDHTVDEVIFIPGNLRPDRMGTLLEGCEIMGIRCRIALTFFEENISHTFISHFQNLPMITYYPTQEMNFQLFIKYALDRMLALVLIVLLSPFLILTILAIKATSSKGENILFRQVRCGLNGKPFVLYKFRSMKMDADREIEELRDESDVDGPVFKMKKDPRVTAVGRFIRRTSIDELPQLFNVLRGQMSLVGPRPPLPEEVLKYDRWQRRRLSMKPGMTCLWQVMGRNKLSFDTWMKLDLEYIDNWSLALDFQIMIRTVFVVATGYGAM
jgi:exopolysaccharide biosynthesis polyprenyl glycosylphosphotransferase